ARRDAPRAGGPGGVLSDGARPAALPAARRAQRERGRLHGAEGQRESTRMNQRQACGEDWLRDRSVAWLWPAAFLTVLVGWLLVGGAPGDVLGSAGFGVAGALCVGNAARCRRVHCRVTGPLYLVAALLFLD